MPAAIRHYRAIDRTACLSIFDSNVPEYFGPHERAGFDAFLDALPGPYLVLEQAGALIGCGGWAAAQADPRTAVLCWGMIARAQHRSGFGRLLLTERLNRIAADGAFSRVLLSTSQHSETFFYKFGFTSVRREHNGYAPGLDLVDMLLISSLPPRQAPQDPS